MQVTDTTTPSNLYATPRSGVYDSLILTVRDESTKEIVTESITFTLSGNYYDFTTAYQFTEGRFYNIEIKEGSNLLFRDKVFCTDQPLDGKFRMTNGKYEVEEESKKYIFNEN